MLNFNGVSWRVVLVSPTHPILLKPDGTRTIGACVKDNTTIYINENLNDEMLKRVLCHEFTHAAMFSYGVILSIEQEELLTDLLATYGEEIIYKTNRIFCRLQNRNRDLVYNY